MTTMSFMIQVNKIKNSFNLPSFVNGPIYREMKTIKRERAETNDELHFT